MRTLKHLFYSLILCIFCTQVLAQTGDDLTQLLINIKAMQADFTQTIQDEKGKVMQKAQGHMALVRPGKFRWDIKQPNPQLIIANGSKLWVYDPDLEQVTVRQFSKAAGQTPALMLSDSSLTLSKDFFIKKMPNPSLIAGYEKFQMIPKDKDNLFSVVTVSFINHQIKEMQLEDHLGHTTTIAFMHVDVTNAVPDSLFVFTSPAGVDVIDETNKHR